jgi:hypothetical protein
MKKSLFALFKKKWVHRNKCFESEAQRMKNLSERSGILKGYL